MNIPASSLQANSSTILDLARFEQVELVQNPFEYMILSGFLKQEKIAAVARDFPAIKQAGSFPIGTLKCGPAFNELIQQLEGETFRHAVERKFNVDLTGRPTMITVRGHTDKTDGRIHTDSKTKIITMLIYFNDAWQKSGGRLRLLRTGTDLENYVAEVEPAMGTLLAFRRSDNSWHGHKPFVGERKALQLNWVLDEQVKRREQKRHGVSAFFKKLFGHKEYSV